MKDKMNLEKLKYDFDPYFKSRVMARMDAEKRSFALWSWLSPALAFVLIGAIIVLTQEGSLTLDSVLGLEGYDERLQDYLMYY